MESKVCTYTEDNVRLQLVKIDNNDGDMICEIRLNRKCIFRLSRRQFTLVGTMARLMFCYYVSHICVDRSFSNLLKIT